MHRQGSCVALLLLILSTSVFDSRAQTQIQGARDNPQVYSGVVYGPIDQNDTLWRIASRYKQDAQFTVYQTMMAIYELNPQAFENGNFNTMVNGAILQLPSDRYIARVDHQQARAKADADDRALGRNSSANNLPPSEQANTTESPSANLKPVVPLVNQDDLSKTSTQLQSQLNTLKNQQQQQFEQLKNQVATSIESVEILLQENKNLSDQLLRIDENNRNLTQQVEIELQTQIDTQVDQLNQLIAIVKESEQRRIDKESQSILQLLSTPLALIIIMSSITLLLIVGLAIFLMRKSPPQTPDNATEAVSEDIVDNDLVIGEVDESVDQDSEDLMAALSQEDELEEDDILSDALEDDDNIKVLSDDMEAELEGLDDMLVPDSPSDIVDFDGTEDKLDEDKLDEDSGADEDNATSLDQPESDAETSQDKTTPTPSAEVLAEEVTDSDVTPSGIELDENGDIDENTIDQISNQIEEKDQAITKMTDELLDELNKTPSGTDVQTPQDDELSGLEESIDTPIETTSPSLEAMLEESEEAVDSESNTELEALLDSIDDAEISDDDLSTVTDEDLDRLIDLGEEDTAELSADEIESDQVSSLTDELLEELESEDSETDELESLLDEIESNEASDEQDDVFLEDAGLDSEVDGSADKGADDSAVDNSSDEITHPTQDLDAKLDADDLLDNIPSFTTDVSVDESENDSLDEIDDVLAEEDNLNTASPTQKANGNNLEDLEEESDEDMLSGLPGLDNWLDEDDETQLKDLSESAQEDELDLSALELDIDDIDSLSNTSSDEDNLINELDGADFDDMLNELDDDIDTPSDSDINIGLEDAKTSSASADPIEESGLDLDALMTSIDSDEAKKGDTTGSDDFVDVDDLLMESEAMPKPSDEEMELDLDSSLDKLMTSEDRSHEAQSDQSDTETNQSSNLDLALVYIDMEDFVAAKELLEEVTRLGTQEQQEEANTLLGQIKS